MVMITMRNSPRIAAVALTSFVACLVACEDDHGGFTDEAVEIGLPPYAFDDEIVIA